MSDPMRPDDPMSRTGAVWCDLHERWECSKNSQRREGRCHASAIRGTDSCRNHAGVRTEVAKAKGEAITAWSAQGGTATVSATEAVLGMLQMSWLRVHLYAGLLEEQVEAAQEARDAEGVAVGAAPGATGSVGPGEGLVGHTFSAVKDVGIYASGEATRGLAALEAQERDRCVRFAKTAHDMGIADAQVRLAEQQGLLLAQVIRRVLDRLGLSAEQRTLVATVVPAELRAVAGGAA